jgi:hypothetical protein
MTTMVCAKFPNTTIISGARKIGRGEFRGYYRGWVRTIERSAWLTPCINTFHSDAVSVTREDALHGAEIAAKEAAATGYVPAF